MDSKKVGEFILKLRKDNNMTQKELADKLGVTYQAVSKWENGRNSPDIALIKKISDLFNVDVVEILEGEKKTNKKNYFFTLIVIALVVIGLFIGYKIISNNNNSFEFKTLSAKCNNFTISGSVAYNDNKTSIYISNIEYCGGNDLDKYRKLESHLYNVNGNKEIRISSDRYTNNDNIKLEDYLKNLTYNINDTTKNIKIDKTSTFYILINATNQDNKVVTYKIPLEFESN